MNEFEIRLKLVLLMIKSNTSYQKQMSSKDTWVKMLISFEVL